MKQCLITFDKNSNTFDVFSGAKGKGFPLTSEVITKEQFIIEVLQKIIEEGIDQGYKVNLTSELETLLNDHIAKTIRSK